VIVPLATNDGLQAGLFYLVAGISSLSGILVVASRNVVHAAVWLLFALLGVAGLFFSLDASFLGAMQIMVYAGGTLVLIVFAVMLTGKASWARFSPRTSETILAGIFAAFLIVTLFWVVRHTPWVERPLPPGGPRALAAMEPNEVISLLESPDDSGKLFRPFAAELQAYLAARKAGEVEAGSPEQREVAAEELAAVHSARIMKKAAAQNRLVQGGSAARTIGQAFLREYLVPFEFASVVLLVVMVGAAYLARPKRGGES
jgi:NADH-quinone oxidoreductase subunit J